MQAGSTHGENMVRTWLEHGVVAQFMMEGNEAGTSFFFLLGRCASVGLIGYGHSDGVFCNSN